MLAAACIWLAVGCSKRNPNLCCENTAECEAVGFSSFQTCDLGVCVNYECTSTPGACDDDGDCADFHNATGTALPACVANTCAVCATSAACPAATPVCDEASHDCRTCAKDAECDSGACDLAAGTCVDDNDVLYTSVAGTRADPCSLLAPCSLDKAAESTDTTHMYIVMAPGRYAVAAVFNGKHATLIGNGASYDAENGIPHFIEIANKSLVTVRNLTLESHFEIPDGDMSVIEVDETSELVAEYVQATATDASTIYSRGKTTIRHSAFTGDAPFFYGETVIDSSTFLADGPKLYGTGQVANSIFIAPAGASAFSLGDSSSTGRIDVVNNTFIGGYINCASTTNYFHSFTDNIFYNIEGIESSGNCSYDYNLFEPSLGIGTNEVTGDPHFVAPGNGDFHLSADSPARDTGAPNMLGNGHDFDGNPRPVGDRVDMGAFEYR